MSTRERISGIWLMAMTLLSLFAFTCYFVAQMWLNILRMGYIALVVSQVLALTIYMWGPEKLKRRWQRLFYRLLYASSFFVIPAFLYMPYPDGYFDIVLMAGCILSYCEADKAIRELARVLKPGGYLVMDYERAGSAVLPFFLRNRDVFQGKYKYMGKPHRSYLYSDKYILRLLDENSFHVLQSMRFNTLYALWDPLPQFFIRKFYSRDVILSNKTFWSRYAHNEILLAVKEQKHE